MSIPFLDLKAQYDTLREDIGDAMQQVLETTAFAGGPFVERFEAEFARYCGCGCALGVGSGTDALWLALLGLGIGPGDEVVTVPNTFIATVEAICLTGAKPVFVDVDPRTFNMNPELIEAALTERTKAILPVHLFGQMADMEPILHIAGKHGLKVIEDASQAHGARYQGRPAGSLGDAGCFSFYPGKNLGAYGEAGAVVTNDPELAEKVRVLRDHGQVRKYHHSRVGWNARMDGLQGAVLGVKLRQLPAWIAARRQHARSYTRLLAEADGIALPKEADYGEHAYHIYAVHTANRDRLLKSLQQRGIQCGIHYPVPVHLQEAFRYLGLPPGSFPVAERSAAEELSLPMFPELSESQIEQVAQELRLQQRLAA